MAAQSQVFGTRIMRTLQTQLRNFAALSSAVVVKSVEHGKRVLFSRYLLATNTVISACSSGLGDSIQQKYEMLHGRMECRNFTRTRNIFITGIPAGVACHYWYIYLDKFLVGKTLKTVGKKILLDQLVGSPVFIGIFLVTMGALEHKSVRSKAEDLWEKGSTLYIAEWLIWPPAQLFNFLFLPTRFRVLYDNMISLGFDCYYPYVLYKNEHKHSVKTNSREGCEVKKAKQTGNHEAMQQLETSIHVSERKIGEIGFHRNLHDIMNCSSLV